MELNAHDILIIIKPGEWTRKVHFSYDAIVEVIVKLISFNNVKRFYDKHRQV